MRLLANENFPGVAVNALRLLGHDVSWVRVLAPGITDHEVMDLAAREQRVLVTLDKDFGELVFRSGLSSPWGLVLFRVSPPMPSRVAALAVDVFREERTLEKLFVVVEEGRRRERPFPNPAPISTGDPHES